MAGIFDLFGSGQTPLGDWLGNNSNALIGLGAGIAGGGNINQSVSSGLQGLMTGRQNDIKLQQQMATLQGLIGQGLSPQQAQLAILNPEYMKAAVPTMFPKNEFHNVDGVLGGFNPYSNQFNVLGTVPKNEKLSAGETLGTVNPQFNPAVPRGLPPIAPVTGSTAPIVPPLFPGATLPLADVRVGPPLMPNKDQSRAASGAFTPVFSAPAKPLEIDAGTHTVLIDPQTQRELARIPKNVAEKASAEIEGKQRGEAIMNLPTAIANTQDALSVIAKIKGHAANWLGTGVTGAIIPDIPGSPFRDFGALVQQLKGKTFLEAFQTLKGGGQITEVEGQKATDAIARLDRAQSTVAFNQALDDFASVLRAGIGRAKLKAGLPAGSMTPPQPPPGFVVQ